MALYDWNKDGKKDFQDDFVEYQIYRDCTNNKNESSSYSDNSGSGKGLLNYVCIVLVIVIIIGAFSEALAWLILIGYGLAVLFSS